MLWTLQRIIEDALERLSTQLITYLPPLLAALVIMAGAWIFATLGRWVFNHKFKGKALDRWLRRTGVGTMLDPSGRLKGARLVSRIVYWSILAIGALTALNAFNTQLTTRMVEGTLVLLPRLAGAVVIVVAGCWLAQYLGRGMLVWAVNEELPAPRRLAALVRVMVVFVAVVVAADHLNFAKNVFLAAFVLLGAAAALGGGLAVGLGGRDALHHYLRGRAEEHEQTTERSLWTHL